MKYELTDETKQFCGRTLHRVRYIDSGGLGGWVESEKNLSQDGNAKVWGGKWNETPLQIHGTKFVFCVSSKNTVTIGCKTKTVDEWPETYGAEFDRHNFTPEQRKEYKDYFNLAAKHYGWEALPEEGGSINE